ncbi:dihydrofolate reductase family protein [Candidatus Woesebacteria bacterium]|nr:dihydrofolate reductase family protein [Candidatus Woesebacteria bacterium]
MCTPIVSAGMAISLDGFTAGINQSFDHPFGENFDVNLLRSWMFEEPEKKSHTTEIEAILDAGAFIMGSNMFGPKDRRNTPEWRGWWGETPPYHAPVFVLSHTKRDPMVMEGGTTFFFITDGIESALEQAKAAAGDRNVKINGGAATLNQYLQARLVDELWLHILPVTIGAGTRLFDGVTNLSLKPVAISGTSLVTHIRYEVKK